MSWLRNLTISIVPNASEAICTALPLRPAGCQFPRVRCVVRQPYDRGFRMQPLAMLHRKRPTTRRVGSEYPDDELTAQNRELFGPAVRGPRSNGRAVDDEDAARHLARRRKLDRSEAEEDP